MKKRSFLQLFIITLAVLFLSVSFSRVYAEDDEYEREDDGYEREDDFYERREQGVVIPQQQIPKVQQLQSFVSSLKEIVPEIKIKDDDQNGIVDEAESVYRNIFKK